LNILRNCRFILGKIFFSGILGKIYCPFEGCSTLFSNNSLTAIRSSSSSTAIRSLSQQQQ
jgi:hypothetical protein